MDDALRRLRQTAARNYLAQRDRLLSAGVNVRYRNDPATGRATIVARMAGGEVKGYELSSTIPWAPHRALALVTGASGNVTIIIAGGYTAEEAESNLADLIAAQVEQEVGHQGMARMIAQLRRGGSEAFLDPEMDQPQARQVGATPAKTASSGQRMHELAELSFTEAAIDQLEAQFARRVMRLREVYTHIVLRAPEAYTAQMQAELEAAAPEWRELLEREAPPDTGITALEREALQRRIDTVAARVEQCEVIGRIIDAALGRLIDLQQENRA